MDKKDFAISLLARSMKRKMMGFTSTEKLNKLTVFDANKEVDVINKLKSKQYDVQYLFIETSFDILAILSGISNEHKVPVIIFHGENFSDEEKHKYTDEYKYIYFLSSVGLSLDILCDTLTKIKLDMLKNENVTKKDRYVYVKELGKGAYGLVSLVMDQENGGKLVALKQIDTNGLTEDTKQKVERELDILKIIKCPTIIEFYDSKTVNEIKYVYMEYAEGGTLEEKLTKAKNQGEKINQDDVFDWILEIMIALYSMHTKNLIHRDIKSENILLCKNLAKLSDMGISREMKDGDVDRTFCGTPFYASPEMVNRNAKYSYNTDVWSLGVVLYELLANEKPFFSITKDNKDLMDKIKYSKPQKLGSEIDIRLKILTELMLIKNMDIRPTVPDILCIDFVQERLLKIIESKSLKIEFLEEIISKKKLCYHDYMAIHNQEKSLKIAYDLSQFANETYKSGIFSSSISNVFSGTSLLSTLVDDLKVNNPEKIIDELMNLKLITEISHPGQGFEDSSSYFYKISFSYLNDSAIDNVKLIDTNSTPSYYDLLDISCYALKCGINLIGHVLKELNDEVILEDINYINFLTALSFFQNYKITSLEPQERASCLLNVYQCMMIHSILNKYLGKVKKKGIFAMFKNNPEITYQFADFTLNEIEIKHVIFRGNKKPPSNYSKVVYNSNPKNGIIDDYLVMNALPLFVIHDFDIVDYLKQFKFHIFVRRGLLSQLEDYVHEYCNEMLSIDSGLKFVTVPRYFQPYISDFTSSKEKSFLNIVIKNYNPKIDKKLFNNDEELEKEKRSIISILMEKSDKGQLKIIFE